MTQNGQQIQIAVCPDCSLARAVQQMAPSKLTIVGPVQQIAPCPFCIFAGDVKRNMEALEGVIRELQGMAMPVVEGPTPPPEPALMEEVRQILREKR